MQKGAGVREELWAERIAQGKALREKKLDKFKEPVQGQGSSGMVDEVENNHIYLP